MQTSLTQSEALMPQTFNPTEVWTVSTGKAKYTLNGSQAQLIKTASLSGQRGLIFFDGFAISLAHIVSMERQKTNAEVQQLEEKRQRYEAIKKVIEG